MDTEKKKKKTKISFTGELKVNYFSGLKGQSANNKEQSHFQELSGKKSFLTSETLFSTDIILK